MKKFFLMVVSILCICTMMGCGFVEKVEVTPTNTATPIIEPTGEMTPTVAPVVEPTVTVAPTVKIQPTESPIPTQEVVLEPEETVSSMTTPTPEGVSTVTSVPLRPPISTPVGEPVVTTVATPVCTPIVTITPAVTNIPTPIPTAVDYLLNSATRIEGNLVDAHVFMDETDASEYVRKMSCAYESFYLCVEKKEFMHTEKEYMSLYPEIMDMEINKIEVYNNAICILFDNVRTCYDPNLTYALRTKNISVLSETEKSLYNSLIAIISELNIYKAEEVEKVRLLHDYLVLNAEYDTTYQEVSHTPEGLLHNKTAVCDGYARTMRLLLLLAGVESDIVTGEGNGEAHAWNMVKIDNDWYHVDVTWDDPVPNVEGRVLYAYFLKSDRYMGQDHEWKSDITCVNEKYQIYGYQNYLCNDEDSMYEVLYKQYPMKSTIIFCYKKNAKITRESIVTFISKQLKMDTVVHYTEDEVGDYCVLQIPVTIPSAEEIRIDKLSYTENDDGTITITGYIGNEENVAIPTTINGKKVTAIGQEAFYMNKFIKRVVLPEGVTLIGEKAFAISSLEEIVLPSTLKELGQGVFEYTNLSIVSLPEGIKTLPVWAFCGCEKLEYVYIPESIRTICDYAFVDCKSLKKIELPNVTFLSNGVFSGCISLNTIVMNSEYIDFAESPFEGCSALVDIQMHPSARYKIVDNVLFSKDGKTLIEYLATNTRRKYTVPETVERIRARAFQNVKGLKEVILPSKIEALPNFLFCDCTDLVKVKIGDEVKTISKGAFQNTAIEEIALPGCLSSLGSQAFYGCTMLKNVEIPKGVKSIESHTFAGCSSLEEVVLSDTIVDIKYKAFAECSLLKSLFVPESVTLIDLNAFGENQKMPILIVTDNSAAQKIAKDSEWRYILKNTYSIQCTDYKKTIYVDWSTALGVYDDKGQLQQVSSWEVSDTAIATINNYGTVTGLSEGHVKVIATLKNGSVVEREYVVSDGCDSDDFNYIVSNGTAKITKYTGTDLILVVPSKLGGYPVTHIDWYTFEYADCIEIYLPESVMDIWVAAFYRCLNLEEIFVSSKNPYFYTQEGILYARDKVLCGVHCDKVLMQYPLGRKESSVRIDEDVDGIYYYAFEAAKIDEVILPTNLKVIAMDAFGRSSLKGTIHIPESVIVIEEGAFGALEGITAFEVHKNNSVYCTKNGIIFTKDMKEITAYPAGSANDDYQIPKGIEVIAAGSFEGTRNLQHIVFNEEVKEIGRSAFYSCGLIEVLLPNSLKRIGNSAFSYNKFQEITVPKNVVFIGSSAFMGTPLERVYFEHTKEQVIDFDDGGNIFSSDATIYGVPGGTAEKFAKETKIRFVPAD